MKNVLFGCSCDCIWNKNNDIAWFSVIWFFKQSEIYSDAKIPYYDSNSYIIHPEISGDIDGKEKYCREVWENWIWNFCNDAWSHRQELSTLGCEQGIVASD